MAHTTFYVGGPRDGQAFTGRVTDGCRVVVDVGDGRWATYAAIGGLLVYDGEEAAQLGPLPPVIVRRETSPPPSSLP